MNDIPTLLAIVPARQDEPPAVARARAIMRLAARDVARVLDEPTHVQSAAATLENYALRQGWLAR